MALNSDTYIHGILYCSKHLNTSPLNIPEKRLIGLMLDFSDVEPAELISVIEVSYNHNLPVLVKNMDFNQLASVYSKLALYGSYRSEIFFIWFRTYALYLGDEKINMIPNKHPLFMASIADKKIFVNWINTHLRVGKSEFFEKQTNRDWLIRQIRYIWHKKSLEKDMNAEERLRSELYLVLSNPDVKANIDSFLDISFNYRVPQNVLSQDPSFKTQLEKRLRLLGVMSKICIEIWARALLTFQEAEHFLSPPVKTTQQSRTTQESPPVRPLPPKSKQSSKPHPRPIPKSSHPKSAPRPVPPVRSTSPFPQPVPPPTLSRPPTPVAQPSSSASVQQPATVEESTSGCGCWGCMKFIFLAWLLLFILDQCS